MLSVTCKPFMLSVFMLNVVMLSVIMLSVIMLSVIMLSVVVPRIIVASSDEPTRVLIFTIKKFYRTSPKRKETSLVSSLKRGFFHKILILQKIALIFVPLGYAI
jgi:hypothetical protein